MRGLAASSAVANPPLILECSADGKWKLFMSVLFQALYEQDEQFVVVSGIHSRRREAEKSRIARVAKEYVKSQDFADVCALAGVDVSFMRGIAPSKAKAAYLAMMGESTKGKNGHKLNEIKEQDAA